jgi:hypothetical protein
MAMLWRKVLEFPSGKPDNRRGRTVLEHHATSHHNLAVRGGQAMAEPEFTLRPLADGDCRKKPSILTLDDLFAHEHGHCLRPHDIARMSGGLYSAASVIADCKAGHLRATLMGFDDEVKYFVITFGDAREYMRPFRRQSVGRSSCWPSGDVGLPQPLRQTDFAPPNKGRSFVYFIQSGEFIKIGISMWIPRRMRGLRHANPHQLECIHSIESRTRLESRTIERELHRRFAAHRQTGEWFRDCDEIRAYIAHSKASQEKAA